jgi:hypothetical protein
MTDGLQRMTDQELAQFSRMLGREIKAAQRLRVKAERELKARKRIARGKENAIG